MALNCFYPFSCQIKHQVLWCSACNAFKTHKAFQTFQQLGPSQDSFQSPEQPVVALTVQPWGTKWEPCATSRAMLPTKSKVRWPPTRCRTKAATTSKARTCCPPTRSSTWPSTWVTILSGTAWGAPPQAVPAGSGSPGPGSQDGRPVGTVANTGPRVGLTKVAQKSAGIQTGEPPPRIPTAWETTTQDPCSHESGKKKCCEPNLSASAPSAFNFSMLSTKCFEFQHAQHQVLSSSANNACFQSNQCTRLGPHILAQLFCLYLWAQSFL